MIPASVFHKKGLHGPVKGTLSELNSADPYFYIKHHLDGTKEVKFHVNLIDLLNRVFSGDALRYVSIEQERFLAKFFKQADSATKLINSGSATPFKDMDNIFLTLDNFLGSYLGVDNDQYARHQ